MHTYIYTRTHALYNHLDNISGEDWNHSKAEKQTEFLKRNLLRPDRHQIVWVPQHSLTWIPFVREGQIKRYYLHVWVFFVTETPVGKKWHQC